MIVKKLLEFACIAEAVRGRGGARPVCGEKPAADEILHQGPLCDALLQRRLVLKVGRYPRGFPVEQQFRGTALASAGKRILEFAFGARDWTTGDRATKSVLRQWKPEPRP